MKLIIFCLLLLPGLLAAEPSRQQLAQDIESVWVNDILHAWYPRCVDEGFGGYLTRFDYQWQPLEPQHKMIVTQARHVWTASKAAHEYPDDPRYRSAAEHGYHFLKQSMWDSAYGGFYQLCNQKGENITKGNEKTTYGNAFGLYGVSAYYELTGDPGALEFAKEIFYWIDKHAHDPAYGGYFQNLRRDGSVLPRGAESELASIAGLKDQNSSIHVLEAFTELYRVWPDTLLKRRLTEMLLLIRDTITTDKGHMNLFFEADWTPISHKDSSEAYIRENYYLDHVSFGHDVETAFLMLEASHVLGIENDERTLLVARRMVDHALANAWDEIYGGLFDEGYYFKGDEDLTILSDHKSWWSQMEALNSFLMMSLIFPEKELYFERFLQQWQFINTYLVDHKYGGVYPRPIARHPEANTARKAQEWKGPYHTSRALENCVHMLKTNELPF